MKPPQIQATITLRYDKAIALKLDNLVIDGPGLVTLTGHNGAGKSSFLLLCAGLKRPTTGEITVDGFAAHSQQAQKRCGYIPDRPILFADMTIADTIAYVTRASGLRAPSAFSQDLIDGFRFTELLDRFPAMLSHGQRQMASIIVGASRDVSTLLLDEPSLSLDAHNQDVLCDVLSKNSSEKLIVVASHEPKMRSASTTTIEFRDGKQVE